MTVTITVFATADFQRAVQYWWLSILFCGYWLYFQFTRISAFWM